MLSLVLGMGLFDCIEVNVLLFSVWNIGNISSVMILLLDGFLRLERNFWMVIFFLIE